MWSNFNALFSIEYSIFEFMAVCVWLAKNEQTNKYMQKNFRSVFSFDILSCEANLTTIRIAFPLKTTDRTILRFSTMKPPKHTHSHKYHYKTELNKIDFI